MNHQANTLNNDGTMIIFGALLFALGWHASKKLSPLQRQHLIWLIVLVAIVILIVGITLILLKRRRHKRSQLQPGLWHKMSGIQFENQMVIWLKSQAYESVIKTEYYDKGVDILATKSGLRYGIQVKRSVRPVGVAAVRAAVAGLSSYGCDQAMVLTNAIFTNQARSLARANNCRLIDGSELKASR